MIIEDREYLDYNQVLIKPKKTYINSRKDVNLEKAYHFKYADKIIKAIPIISANMDTVSTFEAANVILKNNMFCALHKHYTLQEHTDFLSRLDYKNAKINNVFYTIGNKPEELVKYGKLCNYLGYNPNICLDVANGYMDSLLSIISDIRYRYGSSIVIMAGNVCTGDGAYDIIKAGADICKVGLGSGANCMTRSVTGIGVPQFSALQDCIEATKAIGGMVCADGGITCPGDVMKALGLGSDMVMIGSEFGGHDESGGEDIYDKNDVLIGKEVYGMSSGTAMKKHHGGINDYRSSEGRTSIVPNRGPLQDTINHYLGGIRSGMTYINATRVEDIPNNTTFIKVNSTINENYKQHTVTLR